MPFSVTCPGCESVYPVNESLIGKTIRCKKCGELIEVTAPPAAKAAAKSKPVVRVADDDEDDTPKVKRPARAVVDDAPKAKRPARAVAEDDDEEDEYDAPRKGKGSTKKGMPIGLIVGVLAGIAVLGGGGFAAYHFLGKDGSNDQQAQATPPAGGRPEENNSRPQTLPENKNQTRPGAEQEPDNTPPPMTDTTPKRATPPSATKNDSTTTAKTPETKSPVTQAPPPPVTRTQDPPTSAGLTQREYMQGKMDLISLNQVKRASVFFRVAGDFGEATGSGWFGLEPGLIWTNAHVLGMHTPGSKEPKKITAFLNAGTPEQRDIPHSRLKILAVDRDIDLALVQVIGEKDLPVPLRVKPSGEMVEGQGLNTVGYPFGYLPSQSSGLSKKEPEVSIRPTAYTAPRRNEFGQVRRIQLEGGANPGNSGGPVVDANGHVCAVIVEGVHGGGGALSGIALTMGVPTEYVFGLLAGRIGEVEYKTPYKNNGQVHIPVVAKCFDPLNRLGKVGIAGWIGDSNDKYRRPGTEKPAAEATDTEHKIVSLKYDDKTKLATGELILPEPPPGRVFWAQPYFSNSNIPQYWMPGIRIPVTGSAVDRTPADLIVKLRQGSKRSITMSNNSDLSEYVEGEGEAKHERLTVTTTLKVTETVMQPDKQDYAARLRLTFDEIGAKAELGAKEQDIFPKRILNTLNQFAKLAEALGFINRSGEMFRYTVNTLAIQDPTGKALVTIFATDALEALQATSIPLPNRTVQPGETWGTTKNVRLSLAFARVGRGGKAETQVREYKYINKVVYTYVGQRERGGKREAVVTIEGKIAQAPGSKELASGEMKGFALIELDTGTVVEANLENEFELDTSGDGLKKKLSGINKFKLSRGAAAQ